MSDSLRTHRWPWILGLLLLAGSAIGATWALNNNAGSGGSNADKDPTPPAIICIGFADVELGIANLHPLRAGQITWIVKEGAHVKKGDPLVKLDRELADGDVRRAQAALDEAKDNLKKAEDLPANYEFEKQLQAEAIKGARAAAEAAKADVDIKRDVIKAAQAVIDAHVALHKRAEAALAAEEIKLKQMDLRRPELDISRAKADVAAKQAQLEQAQHGLRLCTLEAPANGTVLRVLAQAGEAASTTMPRLPAIIQFVPEGDRIIRAEVLQEWASRVKVGQKVVIEDDTYAGPTWEGEVVRPSNWFGPRRSVIIEPFMINDVRTLECIIKVTSPHHELRIGQRVRAKIKTGA